MSTRPLGAIRACIVRRYRPLRRLSWRDCGGKDTQEKKMTMPAAYWWKEREAKAMGHCRAEDEAKAIVRQIHAPRRTPNGRKDA